jgi:hypothetical protein
MGDKYTEEQLIARARERGLYLPEIATDEELEGVEWSLGRNPRHRRILEEERCLAEEHIKEIWAEREALNARGWPAGPALQGTPWYAAGQPPLARHT